MDYGEPNKLFYGKQVAAALSYLCLAKMDSVTVHTFGNGLEQKWGPKRGKQMSLELFTFLENLEPSETTAFGDARIKLAQLQSENAKQLADIPLPRHALQSLLAMLLALLWVTERWLSERKQRELS